ncbi:MAG: acetate--CoA ligase family protein [Candidatus Buchananbacteria bacterium]
MKKNLPSGLDVFFHPKSIAVIGASTEPGKVGNDILLNLKKTFSGKIYPVNLKETEVEGLKAYSSILKITEPVDLAIVVIPAAFVNQAIDECGQKGCKNVIIISSGFKEVGQSGIDLENQILVTAKKYGIRILGPNCLGYISSFLPVNASFAATTPIAGGIAFISQSGALGTAILDMALAQKLGIGYFVSIGNKSDINEIDLLKYFAEEKSVKVITLYLEEIKAGREFMEIVGQISKKKPVIVFKAGKTAQGQKAASSHTGSIAGSAKAYNVAFAQSGAIEAEGIDEFFNYAKGLALQPLPLGNKIAVVTNAGGPGIIMTDLLVENGLQLALLSENTKTDLKAKLPPAASVTNPIDILGDAKADRYGLAVKAALADLSVDAVLVVLTPQKMTEIEKTAQIIGELNQKSKKPILLCFLGEETITKYYSIYEKYSLPEFSSPLQAVKTIKKMWQYGQWQKEAPIKIKPKDLISYKNKKETKLILEKDVLTEIDVRNLLIPIGFSFHQAALVKTESEATAFAKKIGYPVALKVVSPEIIHKSDVGGVKVNLKNDQELAQAIGEMAKTIKTKMPQAKIDGYLVGEMIKGFEVIAGVKQDPSFGPLLMVGLGGIYTEVFKDIAFRIAPINQVQALAMIKELKIYDLLAGARGQKSLDLQALADILVKLGDFAWQFPEIKEIDFNPVMVLEEGKGGKIVDARFIK